MPKEKQRMLRRESTDKKDLFDGTIKGHTSNWLLDISPEDSVCTLLYFLSEQPLAGCKFKNKAVSAMWKKLHLHQSDVSFHRQYRAWFCCPLVPLAWSSCQTSSWNITCTQPVTNGDAVKSLLCSSQRIFSFWLLNSRHTLIAWPQRAVEVLRMTEARGNEKTAKNVLKHCG